MSIWNTLSAGIIKPKDGWMVDSESNNCLICGNIFSLTTRRHHCRFCYRLVCGTCSDHNLDLDDDGSRNRMCKECFTKLGHGGLVAQDARFKNHSVVHFQVSLSRIDISPEILGKMLTTLQLTGGQLHPSLCCVFMIGNKVVRTTGMVALDRPEWNETFDIRANLSSPLEDHLLLEVRDRSRRLTGDELLGAARIPLNRSVSYTEYRGSYVLLHKGVKSSQYVHLRFSRAAAESSLQQESTQPDLPMYSISIPCAINLSSLPSALRKRRDCPLVHIFPQHSPLHKALFIFTKERTLMEREKSPVRSVSGDISKNSGVVYAPTADPAPHEVLPCNELLLEALGSTWLRMYSGGAYYKGVLLLTTHRVVFIQYPSDTKASFAVTIPFARIPTVSIRRRWKDKFNTLALLCKDQIGYLFVSLRDESEIRTLEVFRRMKSEIKWRRTEDASYSALNPLTVSEQFITLQDGHPLSRKGGDALGASPSTSTNDFSSTNLASRGDSPSKNLLFDNDDLDVFPSRQFEPGSRPAAIASEFDMTTEYERLGVRDVLQWRVTTVNRNFKLCETYPRDLMVPTVISDRHLTVAASQRSARRLPVATWLHPNGAALCRSSQPLVGITVAACPEDETLLMTIRACAFETQDQEGDPWWCEDIVTEEEKSFVTQSTDTPWTEVMSVKTGTVDGGGAEEQPQYDVTGVDMMGSLAGEDLGHSEAEEAAAMRSAAISVDALGDIAHQPIVEGANVYTQPTSYAEALKSTAPTRVRRRDDSVSGWSVSSDTECDSEGSNPQDVDQHRLRLPPLSDEARIVPRSLKKSESTADKFTADGKRLRIVDARPLINAKGNQFMGKGHEIIGRLGGEACTTLAFAGIANIHAMRESYGALRQICCELTSNTNWLQMIHESKWLHHISILIRSSYRVALHLDQGEPVLVHCSDGWDRTAQLVSLSQLLLDPYYRTIEGFKVLISKDFTSFGHMFHHRSGLVSPDESSPIFLQFLDAVWQIWRQMPWEFEFTDSLLSLLAYSTISRFTDDFVFDCEKRQIEYTSLLRDIISNNHCRSCRHKTFSGTPDQGLDSPTYETPELSEKPMQSHNSESDLSCTWRSTGGFDCTATNDAENRSECKECEERILACRRSIWVYVAHDHEHYVNPLFSPSSSVLKTPSDDQCRGQVTDSGGDVKVGKYHVHASPVCDGGTYFTGESGGGAERNTAYDRDFGGTDREAPVHSNEADGCEGGGPSSVEQARLKRIFGEGVPQLSSEDGDSSGMTPLPEPTQLFFVVAGSEENEKGGPKEQNCAIGPSSPSVQQDADGSSGQSNLHGDDLSANSQRPIHLLVPSADIQSLAIWEAVHFKGIPLARTFASSSSAYTQGLEALSRENEVENQKLKELLHIKEAELREITAQLKEKRREVLRLEAEIDTYSVRETEPINAITTESDEDDGFVVFGEPEKELFTCVEGEENGRIISTGFLIENYMST